MEIPPPAEVIWRLAVALAIGLTVGTERHWRERDEAAGKRTAGVRTYALTGLAGGIFGTLAIPAGQPGGALLVAAGLLACIAVQLPFALREAEAEGRFSATSSVATLATYGLGALAAIGELAAAGAGAVAMTAVLAARESLHGLVARITWAELRSAILLLSMTLLALPLVPAGPVPALGGLDPAKLWQLAIILAAVAYTGYLAVRLAGAERGLLLAGAAGGLVSSTAVVLANAAAAKSGGPVRLLAAGGLVAGAVSCLRTAGLALAMAPEIGRPLLLPLGAAAAAMLVAGLALAGRGGAAGKPSKPPDNPFELGAVLKMALLLALVGVAARLAAESLGGAAVLAIGALSGLADVDAVTLSMPALVPATVSAGLAVQAIAVAVAANITAKAGYALAFGNRGYGGLLAGGSLLGLAAGAAGLALA